MPIFISHAIGQTWLFIGVLVLAIAATARQKNADTIFPIEATHELKGLAILFVILSHIGYFLVNDHRFLVPLSNYAGVGVDLFLILSGYGLTVSCLKQTPSLLDFYRKRLSKICLPVALTVILFTVLDALVLRRFYPLSSTIQNVLGIFPHADLVHDVNSPLWFITLIIMYYLAFPVMFYKRAPIVTAGMFAVLGVIIIGCGYAQKIFPSFELTWMYRLHMFAFPLGIGLAQLIVAPPRALTMIVQKITAPLARSGRAHLARSTLALLLLGIFIALSSLSFVGTHWIREEALSVTVALIIIGFWITKPFEIKILRLVGLYSFELYLLHWPVMSRYDIFFGWLPAGMATVAYLILLIAAGALFQKAVERISAACFSPSTKRSHS